MRRSRRCRQDAPRVLAQLPEAPRRDAQRALAYVEAGRFSKLRAEMNGTLGELAEAARQRARAPGRGALEASLADATIRLGEADRARTVDARSTSPATASRSKVSRVSTTSARCPSSRSP
jgi:hypothetical protein